MPRLFQVLDDESLALVFEMASPELQPALIGREPDEAEPDYYLLVVPRKCALGQSRKKTRREILLKRDGNRCWICKAEFTTKNPPTLDHVQELSQGGKDRLDNLKLAHQLCNSRRSNSKKALAVLAYARVKHDTSLRSA